MRGMPTLPLLALIACGGTFLTSRLGRAEYRQSRRPPPEGRKRSAKQRNKAWAKRKS